MKVQILVYFTGEADPNKLGLEDKFVTFHVYKHPQNLNPFDPSE